MTMIHPQKLVSYFETHYTGGERSQGPRRCRGEPTLPIELWKVYEWTTDKVLRTNNSAESFAKQCKARLQGFPGGAVVESLPANAGDTGSGPGLGGSHMRRGGWAREPQLLSLRAWSLCSATGEAAIVRGPRTVMGSGPRLPQLEKALAQKRRPNTAINKMNKINTE